MTRVLVIEDNEDNRELIDFLLQAAGFETMHAVTGLEGVKMALEEKPDLLICDIQLPDIDGKETLIRIKQNEETKHIPSIAMTSYAMAGDREKLLAAGFTAYIEKPIDPERVIGQIQEVVDGEK